MTQKSKLVTPDVVFNILNAELSSLATSFATSLNADFALVEKPRNLFVESYKTSTVLHIQDSPVPNSILMVYEVCLRAGARPFAELAEKLSLPERIPPAQRPAGLERPTEPESTPPTPPAEAERPA
ncbi:uncharacterized protein TNCV_768601 [Trichonephila clavipes]|nr:uncharacterized protein TNCV_768601 [Trichonephila clavipes]